MEIIDLSQAHAYKDCKIQALAKVKHTDGKEYTQITYETAPSLVKRIVKVAACALLCSYLVFAASTTFWLCIFVWLAEENVSQNVLSSKSMEDHLWDRIHRCPSVEKLFWRAKSEQPNIYLNLQPRSKFKDMPEGSTGAAWINKGKLDASLGKREDAILSTIVFELTNFAQRHRFNELDRTATNAEQYAEGNERIEFDGMKMHHEVVSEAIKTNKWAPSIDKFKESLDVWKDFAGYWRDRKNHPHAEFYRKDWHKRHAAVAASIQPA